MLKYFFIRQEMSFFVLFMPYKHIIKPYKKYSYEDFTH